VRRLQHSPQYAVKISSLLSSRSLFTMLCVEGNIIQVPHRSFPSSCSCSSSPSSAEIEMVPWGWYFCSTCRSGPCCVVCASRKHRICSHHVIYIGRIRPATPIQINVANCGGSTNDLSIDSGTGFLRFCVRNACKMNNSSDCDHLVSITLPGGSSSTKISAAEVAVCKGCNSTLHPCCVASDVESLQKILDHPESAACSTCLSNSIMDEIAARGPPLKKLKVTEKVLDDGDLYCD